MCPVSGFLDYLCTVFYSSVCTKCPDFVEEQLHLLLGLQQYQNTDILQAAVGYDHPM